MASFLYPTFNVYLILEFKHILHIIRIKNRIKKGSHFLTRILKVFFVIFFVMKIPSSYEKSARVLAHEIISSSFEPTRVNMTPLLRGACNQDSKCLLAIFPVIM